MLEQIRNPLERWSMRNLDSSASVRFTDILFTTDLSAAAERALPYAVEIAGRYHAKLHAVHVVQPDAYVFVPPAPWPQSEDGAKEFRQQGRRRLDEQLREIPHEILFEQGETWPTLEEIIRNKEIDLIVLSTHGRTGFGKALLGSVAEQIFRQAVCPVLTVGPHSSPKPRSHAELNCILYATDFSPESLAGAPYAISLAREHRAQLVLFHCLEKDGDIPTFLHTLRDIVPFGTDLRCEPDCVVERGRPAEKILEAAEGHGADLIVLGVHGADGRPAKTMRFARTGVYRIVTQAKCPVLTVRG